MWTGPNDAPLSTKHERMAKLQQQLKGRPMINADDIQKIAQLFHRHTFEQSRGNPLFIVRSYGVIEAFTYADADTLSKALELFPEILARVGKLEAQLKLAVDANARFAAINQDRTHEKT